MLKFGNHGAIQVGSCAISVSWVTMVITVTKPGVAWKDFPDGQSACHVKRSNQLLEGLFVRSVRVPYEQRQSGLCCSLQGGFAFAYVEGALATALKNGSWLLLDEVTHSLCTAPRNDLFHLCATSIHPLNLGQGTNPTATRSRGSAVLGALLFQSVHRLLNSICV